MTRQATQDRIDAILSSLKEIKAGASNSSSSNGTPEGESGTKSNEGYLKSIELHIAQLLPSDDLDQLAVLLPPLESGLSDHINNNANNLNTNSYNLWAYDRLIERGVDYLGRALVNRDDAMEFSLRYLNDLWGRYNVFLELREDDAELGPDGSLVKSIAADTVLANELAAGGDLDPVDGERANILRMKADAQHLKDLIPLKTQRLEHARKRLAGRFRIAKSQNEQAAMSGGALKFKERIERLRKAFKENMLEAYWLLRAADEGLTVVFEHIGQTREESGYERFRPFPEVQGDTEIGYADKLLEWARHASFLIDRDLHRSSEVRLLFYVAGQTVRKEQLDALNAGGLVKFEIPKARFGAFTELRAVSARVFWLDDQPQDIDPSSGVHYHEKSMAFSGVLQAPTIEVNGKRHRPPELRFTDAVSLSADYEPAHLDQAMRNCRPYGTWELQFDPEPNYSGLQAPRVSESNMEYVFVEIIARGVHTR